MSSPYSPLAGCLSVASSRPLSSVPGLLDCGGDLLDSGLELVADVREAWHNAELRLLPADLTTVASCSAGFVFTPSELGPRRGARVAEGEGLAMHAKLTSSPSSPRQSVRA